MEEILIEHEDPRMYGNGDIFNSYGYSEERGWNYYERFMAGGFTIETTGWVNPGDQAIQIVEKVNYHENLEVLAFFSRFCWKNGPKLFVN